MTARPEELVISAREALQELFRRPCSRTDGEILREVTELARRLADETVVLTGVRRLEAEARLAALRAEQAERKRGRSGSDHGV